jgi:RNA polymerase sigma factor (sigma-70 family)
MDEEQLRMGCLAGDPEAWERLRAVVVRLTYGLAAQRLNLDHHAVDDVAQMTLVALLRDDMRVLRSFRGSARLSSYLATIILRMALRYSSSRDGETPLEGADRVPAPSSSLEPAEAPTLLSGLSPADRLIVILGADDYSSEEIARALEATLGLKITAAAVRKRKERAFARLRESIANDENLNQVGGVSMNKAL